MGVLQVVLRAGVVVLLLASSWYGVVAGGRRWRPCTGDYDSQACVTAQTHETANLAELAHPESTSIALLGGALVLLALMGRMPLRWRLAALTTGPVCWSMAVVGLRDVGQTDVALSPTGGHETTVLQAAVGMSFVLVPFVLAGAGLVLLTRPAAGDGPTSSGRGLSLAWFALALGWPLPEYFLLNLLQLPYVSHDAPPGTGLLRSALTVVAAVVVLRSLTVRAPAGAGQLEESSGRLSPGDRGSAGRDSPGSRVCPPRSASRAPGC